MVIHIYGITLNAAKSADQYYFSYSYQSSSLISYLMYNDFLYISIYPLPTHPTHNFTHKNGGNLDTLPG